MRCCFAHVSLAWFRRWRTALPVILLTTMMGGCSPPVESPVWDFGILSFRIPRSYFLLPPTPLNGGRVNVGSVELLHGSIPEFNPIPPSITLLNNFTQMSLWSAVSGRDTNIFIQTFVRSGIRGERVISEHHEEDVSSYRFAPENPHIVATLVISWMKEDDKAHSLIYSFYGAGSTYGSASCGQVFDYHGITVELQYPESYQNEGDLLRRNATQHLDKWVAGAQRPPL